MRKELFLIPVLASALLLAGCQSGGGPAVAVVGSEKITQTAMDQRIATFPAEAQEALKDPQNQARILDQLIEEALIIDAAKKAGFAKKESFVNQINTLENQLLVNMFITEEVDRKVQVTENDLQSYYQQNAAFFQEGSRRRAQHVLVDTEAEAKAIYNRLKRGEKFATIAKSKSKDPGTKDAGGDLGWFSRGQLVPEFENAVYGLKKGQLSKPVKSQFGYHVIKLNDLSPAISYQDARQQIQQAVFTDKKRALTLELLEKLKAETKVKKHLKTEENA